MDDIVTRLAMFSFDDGTDALNKVLTEAVDEIERLRLQVFHWRRIADVCVIAIGVPKNDTDSLAVELYDKAVRGE